MQRFFCKGCRWKRGYIKAFFFWNGPQGFDREITHPAWSLAGRWRKVTAPSIRPRSSAASVPRPSHAFAASNCRPGGSAPTMWRPLVIEVYKLPKSIEQTAWYCCKSLRHYIYMNALYIIESSQIVWNVSCCFFASAFWIIQIVPHVRLYVLQVRLPMDAHLSPIE